MEPVAAACVNRHLALTREWNPHDYVPWSDGHDFAALGGEDWNEHQSKLSDVAKIAMITNLLTEDNLPSYHRYIVANLSPDSAWGTWARRWTAEEARHSIAMRDYLVATRAVDPVALETYRMQQLSRGAVAPEEFEGALAQLIYATLQEVATRVSHRQTGLACADPVADVMLKQIARDENLHAVFYRDVTAAAFDLTPDQTVEAVTRVVKDFDMPGRNMPNFRRNALVMAKHGIYDLPQHLTDVLRPILRAWRVFERNDLGQRGDRFRNELGEYLDELQRAAGRFEERRARRVERDAARAGHSA